MTALMFAAQGGHIKVMNELLQKGANPNVKTTSVSKYCLTVGYVTNVTCWW
jgi:ankyrin repeat protein